MGNVIPLQLNYSKCKKVSTVYDKDSVKTKEELYNFLEGVLGRSFSRIEFRKKQKVATGTYRNSKGELFFFLLTNVTFMGGVEGQHPKDLKRIQYTVMWREFYEKYSKQGEVFWLGLYSYNDINVVCYFYPQSYLKKHEGMSMLTSNGKMSRYSCHIFLNDIYQAVVIGSYEKEDKNHNIIGAVASQNLKRFFESKETLNNPIIDTIKKINQEKISWNKWIRADYAIPYMKKIKEITGFGQWKQNMWNGWYIEALYSEFLHDNPSPNIEYVATTKNDFIRLEYEKTKLDLAFQNPSNHFIGDLKAVSDGTGDTLLNDVNKVNEALEKYGRIWFLIYFHKKLAGSTNDYEMVKWRNHFILEEGEWLPSKKHLKFDEMSASQTPHSVSYYEMVIIELNEVTKDKYFKLGKQWGLNSNGAERSEKYKINKKLLKEIKDDSFVIYREQH